MIFFGTKSVYLKAEKAEIKSCPKCNAKESLVNHFFSKYFYILGIPIIPAPLHKWGKTVCTSCEHILKGKALPLKARKVFQSQKDKARPKWWEYSGLLLLGGFLIWNMVNHSLAAKKMIAYLSDPKKGDVYFYEKENGRYSTIKVRGRKTDSIFVSFNQYETIEFWAVYGLDENANYLSKHGMRIEEIIEMYEAGFILDMKGM